MMWVRRFEVIGSSGDRYTVAIAHDSSWGCSCPAWRFKKKDAVTGLRPDCKHILAVAAGQLRLARMAAEATQAPGSRFAGLDMEPPATIAATVALGARFRHLDFDVRAVA